AYERSQDAAVGKKLVEVLAKAPGLQSISPESLARILRNYPEDVRQVADPLFKRLEVNNEKQRARLTEMEPVLSGGKSDKGKEVFFGKKAGCRARHSVQSLGGQGGPDLRKSGAIRSGPELLVAILLRRGSCGRRC